MNKKLIDIFHSFNFDFQVFIFRKRILLVFLFFVVLFFTYLEGGNVVTFAINEKVTANAWDVIFSTLGSGPMLFLVLTPVFLLFISDIPVTTHFDEFVLPRLNSRSKWLWSKIIVLIVSTFLYLATVLVIIITTTSFGLPLNDKWSEMALNYPRYSYLSPQIPKTFSVISAFMRLIVLLILGWLGIGITVLVSSLFLNNATFGFLIGTFIDLGGYFSYHGYIPQCFANFFVSNHMILSFHSFGENNPIYPQYSLSIIYWMLWIFIFTVIGFFICRKKDFLLGKVTS